MKVYLASEQKELCIRLANIINRSGNTCIMSDDDSDDYRVLIKDIRDSISGYDMSILISRTPMEAVIEANKTGGIRATVCKDVEDTAAAMKAKSNMVILDAAKLYRMDTRGIVKSIEDSYGGTAAKQRVQDEIPSPKREKAVPQAREPAAREPGGGGISGMLGSIKNVFGADDSEPKEKEPKFQKKAEKATQKPQRQAQELPPKKKGKGGIFGSLKDTFGVE